MSDFVLMFIIVAGPLAITGAYKMWLAFHLLFKYDITIEEAKDHEQYLSRLNKVSPYIRAAVVYFFIMLIMYNEIISFFS